MALQQELTQRVREGLARNDMTQRDLADSAGLSEKHVSQMLAGKSGTLAAWDSLISAIERNDLLNDWFAHIEGCTGCAADEPCPEVTTLGRYVGTAEPQAEGGAR